MAHSLGEAESYLVVRLGAVGDALRVCPAVRRLRRERPHARIGWAVENWVYPVLAPSSDVDRFHILDRRALRAGGRAALREMRRFSGEVRGAHYDVALDFHGHLKLTAKVSQTMTGLKRWRLKPVDPILSKEGAGTYIAIKVQGSAKDPKFGRD